MVRNYENCVSDKKKNPYMPIDNLWSRVVYAHLHESGTRCCNRKGWKLREKLSKAGWGQEALHYLLINLTVYSIQGSFLLECVVILCKYFNIQICIFLAFVYICILACVYICTYIFVYTLTLNLFCAFMYTDHTSMHILANTLSHIHKMHIYIQVHKH